jgi:hypothetical protein
VLEPNDWTSFSFTGAIKGSRPVEHQTLLSPINQSIEKSFANNLYREVTGS